MTGARQRITALQPHGTIAAMPPCPPPALPIGHTPPQVAAGLYVALSGGLDSMALLHALATGPAHAGGVRALHVHHGLHAAADDWAAACTHACAQLGVALTIVRVDVERHGGEGIEAAARAARLDVFARTLADGGVIALGHHLRDQAETFLLRALRASGVDGLAAMSPLRSHAGGWLWRPLLAVPRDTLHAYALAHRLHWVDDPSNQDDALARNFLRLRVLPLLRTRWPGVDAALARSATLAREATALLDAGDDDLLATGVRSDGTLEIAPLRAVPPARAARVLRRWVATRGLPPLPANGVRRIMSDLLGADASPAIATFGWSGAAVSRWRGVLHGYHVYPPLPAEYRERWDGSKPLHLPGGDQLCLVRLPTDDTISAGCAPPLSAAHPAVVTEPVGAGAGPRPFVVHVRRGGERIRLPGRGHDHALKHVLQDAGVPPWLRARMPLLSSPDGDLLAAGDRILAHGFEAGLRRHGVRLAWLRAEAGPVTGDTGHRDDSGIAEASAHDPVP